MTTVSHSIRFKVLQRDKFRCTYCGASAQEKRIEIDHVKAKANGGENNLDNYVAACFDCNRGKSDKDVLFDDGGEQPISAKSNDLIGKCFVIWGKDDWQYQGIVRGKLSDDTYLVQFFDALMGKPATLHCVALVKMLQSFPTKDDGDPRTRQPGDFEFFEDDEHLRFWCRYVRPPKSARKKQS